MNIDKIKTNLKINDNVVVVSGNDRGKRGKILHFNRLKNRVVVEGINKIKRFVKPSQENPKGGVVVMEYPIHLSNVMFFCDKCKKGVRLAFEMTDSKKTRKCGKCGKSLE